MKMYEKMKEIKKIEKQEKIKKCQHTHLIECQMEYQDVYQLVW